MMKLDLGEPVDLTGDGLVGSLWGGLRRVLMDSLGGSLKEDRR